MLPRTRPSVHLHDTRQYSIWSASRHAPKRRSCPAPFPLCAGCLPRQWFCHHRPGYSDALGHVPWSNRLKWVAGRLYERTARRNYAPPTAYSTTADFPHLQQYAQNCLQQLESVFPGISAHYTDRAALSYPTGDPFLLGSYACWRVGQYTRFGGYEGVRQGSVHFAGEHCSVEFQGYMEGAAREGARAAGEIVQDVASGRYGASTHMIDRLVELPHLRGGQPRCLIPSSTCHHCQGMTALFAGHPSQL